MPLRPVRGFVTTVALSVAAALTALPASAAPTTATVNAAETVRAVSMPGSSGTPESCQTATSYAGYQWGGLRRCPYRWGAHHFSGGTIQIYVVGTDRKVWTKWRNPNGSFSAWQVLKDGRVRSGDHWSINVTTIDGLPMLEVIGDEAAGRIWCTIRSSSGWTDWNPCVA